MAIYMDNMAGTKPDKRVIEAMLPWVTENFGNPSAHFYPLGRDAYNAIEEAREKVACFLNADKKENIIFTSCGTESNNLALKGYMYYAMREGKKHVITTEIEHFSIQNALIKMHNDGLEFTKLKVDNSGRINIEDLKAAIRPDTALVSIANGNPEIGVIQESELIGRICKEAGVKYHVDAVAACGRINVDVKSLNADMVSIAAQNFYGPRGAAALYVKDDILLRPLLDGGTQERGIRSGSENVAAIVGMGAAASIVSKELAEYTKPMYDFNKHMFKELANMYDYIHFTGSLEHRMPGHVSFWIEYIEGEALLLWYSLNGVYAASGSACSSNILAEDDEDLFASPVLTAVGVPNDICAGSISFTMSRYTTEEEVDKILQVTPEIVDKLTKMSPAFNR